MPPPINTGGGGGGYGYAANAPPHANPAPPGYPLQPSGYGYPAPAGPHAYGNRVAEVEGNQRNRAQLIVGIDFVGRLSYART
jgi:hypothetical protein